MVRRPRNTRQHGDAVLAVVGAVFVVGVSRLRYRRAARAVSWPHADARGFVSIAICYFCCSRGRAAAIVPLLDLSGSITVEISIVLILHFGALAGVIESRGYYVGNLGQRPFVCVRHRLKESTRPAIVLDGADLSWIAGL